MSGGYFGAFQELVALLRQGLTSVLLGSSIGVSISYIHSDNLSLPMCKYKLAKHRRSDELTSLTVETRIRYKFLIYHSAKGTKERTSCYQRLDIEHRNAREVSVVLEHRT